MKKIKNKLSIIAASTTGLLVAGQSANAALWDDGGAIAEFSTAENWEADIFPGDLADNTKLAEINGVFTVERSVDSSVDRTFVNNGAVLNVTGGTHSDGRSGSSIRNFVGSEGSGTVNHSGGSWDIGHLLSVGGNGTGVYNLSGGSLSIFRGGNTLAGNPNTFGGSSGGSLSIGNGSGTGLVSITGGSLESRIGVEVGDRGTFEVLGDGSSSIGIGSNGSLDGHWWQDAGGVLSMGIGAGGITSIFIDDTGSGTTDPYARFEAGAVLDLDFFGTAAASGTWTLLELENQDIDDQGLVLAAGDAAAGWTFDIDNTGTNGLLTATFTAAPVPEPSSTALLGLGGLALILRRRK